MDMRTKVSEHFTIGEFVKSSTAERSGIDNTPPESAIQNIKILADFILEKVRTKFGPVHINSGYRCAELNKAVGSKETSQHRTGQAADFECPPHSNVEVAQWIQANLVFDQLILEYYTPGDPSSGWVHCSYNAQGTNRKQVLTIGKNGTQQGLHP